jgi:hypothetical protein
MLRKIKRVLKWIPVIWKSYDDGYGLLDIMSFHLKLSEKDFREHGHCVNSGKYADEMRLAALLIDRISKEDYVHNAFDCVENKDNPPLNGAFVKRPFVPKQEIWEYEEYMVKQDLELLAKLLKNKVRCWWD